MVVLTLSAGVRVPDVVWMPKEEWEQFPRNSLIEAPDLVVEVLSPDNRQPEMNHKIHGYFNSGVKEVIIINLPGGIE